MKRNLVGSCGWLVAIGRACQPAHAGDRKSAGQVQEAKEEIVVARKVQAVSLRYEMVGASAARPFEARYSASADHRSSRDRGTENAPAKASEHKPLTLYRFSSKFGDIAVQPVIGHVNGAQFSLGF
jgi:hypothetical protein